MKKYPACKDLNIHVQLFSICFNNQYIKVLFHESLLPKYSCFMIIVPKVYHRFLFPRCSLFTDQCFLTGPIL